MTDEPTKVTLTRLDDGDVLSFTGDRPPMDMMHEIGAMWANRKPDKPVVFPCEFEVVDLRAPHA